ncbi:MAG TPA: 2TM domain-containing protein [Nocardioidaceae bacterium]
MSNLETPHEDELREQALRNLRKRRDFHAHLLVYVMVNGFLALIWWMLTPDIFFWPVIPIVVWGIGVVMNGYDVYFGQNFGEEDIDREVRRMQHKR